MLSSGHTLSLFLCFLFYHFANECGGGYFGDAHLDEVAYFVPRFWEYYHLVL